ncbi:hypothetical protein GCM10010371_59310 [Streptomyces subrutilus]|uniref:DUF3558 domain-containing protein n=1 Tax=Streptomyces subrutilus TaxID=36818 RepID=A0A918RDQ4_9ACTN|nr:hypothetical protein [Streptomyces subrutilus]GGZ91601.1 hypothetical protein GCM10010371_59310 [Streptomyces subrutilus]
MHISADVRKALARSTVAVLSVLLLSSCGAGDSEVKSASLCETAASSEEGALLRKVLRADDFETQISNNTSRFAKDLGRELAEMGPAQETLPSYACAYRPGPGVERVTFGFGWVPRASKDVDRPLPKGVAYEMNGVAGATNDTVTRLRVPCDMPGGLGEASKSAWLYADASYTVNIGRSDVDQAALDRQTTLTYLMTRRVADALGCENKPLEKAPVVKPAPTP